MIALFFDSNISPISLIRAAPQYRTEPHGTARCLNGPLRV